MVKTHKLHKIAGLSAGLILIILGISGFFLNHDKWSFLYDITFSHLPEASKKADKKLFDAYYIDENNTNHIIVGGKRGIYESYNNGDEFNKLSNLQCLAIKKDNTEKLYAATSDGIYTISKHGLEYILLQGEYITSIALSDKYIVAVIDKHLLLKIDKKHLKILEKTVVKIDPEELSEAITLSRFVRDLHYGRGLFEGDISLLLNDYAAVILSILALSGYMIWRLISKKRTPKTVRKLIKVHANLFSIIAGFILVILAVTGIFLDHSSGLSKFMKSITIPHTILPPVYSTLKHDIWSVDFDGKITRIGNRYGVYKSDDLKNWVLENKGFAYKMIRISNKLYVSGMGAPNRIYDGKNWRKLQAPHMFRDVMEVGDRVEYFARSNNALKVPTFDNITLYSLLLTLHDGTFFSTWWIWINDYASVMLLILIITGTLRYRAKRRKKKIYT